MVNFREDRPAYRVNSDRGFYADDHLFIETEGSGPIYVYWDEEPNEDLEPMNKIAQDKMNTFLEKLDQKGREVAEKLGKAFAGRPRSLDGALEVATAVQRENMSVMGSKTLPARAERIEDDAVVPQTGITHGKPRGKPGRPKSSLAIT